MDMKAYYASAAMILKFWIAVGLTLEQACGMLAQADAESSLDPKAVGDHGQAFGLNQWHESRVDAIRNGCGVDLRALPPLEDQLKAAHWELTHTEKRAWTAIKQAKTAYDAGYAACRFWERPGAPGQYAKRGQKAESWKTHFLKNPVA
ncbi:phage tail tip lysozyme [Rhodoblastus sphagnicola]|nr:phage tail tip lysozyme [Rhodoblastus sphagnicola]